MENLPEGFVLDEEEVQPTISQSPEGLPEGFVIDEEPTDASAQRDSMGIPTGYEQEVAVEAPVAQPEAPQSPNALSTGLRAGFDFLGNPVGTVMDLVYPSMKEEREKAMKSYGLDPEEAGRNKISEGLADITGGVINAPLNMIETGLAVTDTLSGGETAKSFNETVPKYHPDDAVGGILTEAGELGAGLVTGGAVAKTVVQGFPRLVQALITFGSAEVGAASAVNKDAGGLLIGDKSMFNLVQGLGKDENDTYSQDLLKSRVNLLADGLATSGIATGALKGAGWMAGFLNDFIVKPMVGVGSVASQEARIGKEIMDQLISYKPDMPEEEVAKIQERIFKIIEENKEIIIKSTNPKDADLVFARDTMSALEEGLSPKDDAALIATLRGMRKGMEGRGASELEAVLGAPNKQTDEFLTTQFERKGGEEAIEASRDGIVRSGQEEVGTAMAAREAQNVALEGTKATLDDVIRNDPTFGTRMNDFAGKPIDLSVLTRPEASNDEVVKALKGTLESAIEKKDALAAKIPEGIPTANYDEISSIYNDMLDNKEVPEFIKKKILDAGDDFKKLYQTVTPELSRVISANIRNGTNFDGNSAMRLMRTAINEAAPNIDEAKEFAKYYAETYAPMTKDGIMKDFTDLYQDTVGRSKGDTVSGIGKENFKVGSYNIVNEAVGHPKKVEQLVEVLSKTGDQKHVVDMILGDAANRLSNLTRQGAKLNEVDVSSILGSVQKYASQLEKAGPEEARRLESFMNTLRNSQGDISKMTDELELLTRNAEEVQNKVYSDTLGKFFDSSGKDMPNGFDSFKKMLDNPQSQGQFEALRKRVEASGDPLAKEGMKAAYFKYMKDNIFRAGEGKAAEPKVNTTFWTKMKGEKSPILQYGEEIFKDEPELMQVLNTAISEIGRISDQRGATAMNIANPAGMTEAAGKSINTLITWTFGVLNHTAARLRTGTTALLAKMSPEKKIHDMMDRVFADPDEFLRIVRNTSVKKKEGVMSKEGKDLMRHWLVKNGLVTTDDVQMYDMESDEDINDQMEDLNRGVSTGE